jgi:CRP/FNR family transcriptional regulator, cyclic AMP receptor protein
MTTATARATALADHPFLSSLPAETIRRLAVHAYPHDYAKGDTIFSEGAAADRFLLLRDGRIRLDMDVPERGQVEVETLDADCVLGWSWLFEPYEWQLTATAIEPCRLLIIDAAILRSLMAADPVLGYELMRRFAGVLFDRLQATRSRLGQGDVDVHAAGATGPWAGTRANAQQLGISRTS